MECNKCNKEITNPLFNEYGVQINSIPDQSGKMYYYCNACAESNGLSKIWGSMLREARNKLNRQISTLKKVTLES